MMEAVPEEEIGKNKSDCQPEGSKRPKRQMKTPFQLEMLEKTYATEAYPSEVTRADLSVQLSLTDRQLQMWFCHRRLKDKKGAIGADKKDTVDVAPTKRKAPLPIGRKGLYESLGEEQVGVHPGSEHGSDSASSLGSESNPGSGESDNEDDLPNLPPRYCDSPRTIMEHRIIACVEAQLGQPIRQDGPILGVEFDELMPGAFDATTVSRKLQDDRHPYESKLFGQYDSRPFKAANIANHDGVEPEITSTLGHLNKSYVSDHALHVAFPKNPVDGRESCTEIYTKKGRQLQFCLASVTEDFLVNNDDPSHLSRKRKGDEALIGKEVKTHGKKNRKEVEKQDLLKRKREELLRKETERLDRERRKEEQRLMKEMQRQEEKHQREERREMERREKIIQKELLREEKRMQKEENRREKEEARQKAAMERATAQRIAKESMGLIEDERLELLDLAAARKGLPSIFSMDYDTLENIDSFREALCQFPPKIVQLRKPFTIDPWLDSDKNIGNLLMVWKFCVTFADILGLWPFTLDEFLQAFYDHESRLLGEIHIAMLKLIINDIEDVMRIPSGGPGTNQYSAINAEGGHPRIVEGGYLWGFDIRNWQKYLNPLTWPEILRQFGLSAGFGPQLKKKAANCISLNQTNETKGCEEIVSNLRSGSAAESAFAIMQEKGLTVQRKSRHRLTPGTVKFAAYHVLALEGSKGLNVIEIADKIQKSGLRDLTTSKTPEASISVALSRDPVLFERIAPSTYCVRPAFRKDPADALSLIAAAKEKIQKYANVFLSGQMLDEEERDDDSDSDVADGTEVDASLIPLNAGKSGNCKDTVSTFRNCEEKSHIDPIQQNLTDTGFYVPGQGFEIDESRSGQAWVFGLTEGDYSDLSVEDRLNALVALIGVANEGNSIRVILEERMDASDALKKQMWSEAQLDKRRIKEENIVKFDNSCNAVGEVGLSPLTGEHRLYDPSTSSSRKDDPFFVADFAGAQTCIENVVHHTFTAQSNFPSQQNGNMTEKSRLQIKSYIYHMAEEQYSYRSLPLGQDRRRNRYWQFVASASCLDPASGRIFVESVNGKWSLLDSEEAFDALLASLDTRGTRESHLHTMLKRIEKCFKEYIRSYRLPLNVNPKNGMQKATKLGSRLVVEDSDALHGAVNGSNSDTFEAQCSLRVDTGKNETEVCNILTRYEDLRNWMIKECFNASVLHSMAHKEKRCIPLFGICNTCVASNENEFGTCALCDKISSAEKSGNYMSNSSPLRVRLIKAILTLIEATVRSEALDTSWTEEHRRKWASELEKSSSIEDLLQILTEFEGAIKRDHISTRFETTKELLSHYDAAPEFIHPAPIRYLPWIPKTAAAVALRLLELDESVCYNDEQRDNSLNEKRFESQTQSSAKEERNSKSRQTTHGRGGRSRAKFPKKLASSNRRTIKTSLPQQSVRLPGQTHGRGRRTVRKRRSENMVMTDDFGDMATFKTEVTEPRISARDMRNFTSRNTLTENDESSNSFNSDESENVNEERAANGFERWGASAYNLSPNRSETSEDNVDNENGYEDDDVEGDMEMKDDESAEDDDDEVSSGDQSE